MTSFTFAYLRYAMGQRTVPRRTRFTIASRMTVPSNEMSNAGKLKLRRETASVLMCAYVP